MFDYDDMERRGGYLEDAIPLDDYPGSDPDQDFLEFIDLEDDGPPPNSDGLPPQILYTGIFKTPVAQMVSQFTSEPLQINGCLRQPGQARLEAQAKAGAIAASIRKDHGERLRQRAEESALYAPVTPVDVPASPQQEQQPRPRLMGQKLGLAALADNVWRNENLGSGFASNSGEESPGVAVDTTHLTKKHSCSRCGKVYANPTGLSRHKRKFPNCAPELPTTAAATKTFSGSERYICDRCGKRYLRSDRLKRHQRDHPDCDKETLDTIATSRTLSQADRSACEKCGRSYADMGTLTKHQKKYPDCDVRRANTTTITDISDTERCACHKCGKTYSRKDSVRKHNIQNPNCDTEGPRAHGAIRATAAPIKLVPKVQPESHSPITLPVINPNRKRPIGQIPIGTLFDPGQIISKQQYDAKRQRTQEKHEKKQEIAAYHEIDTIVFDGPEAARSELGPSHKTEEGREDEVTLAIDGELATELFGNDITIGSDGHGHNRGPNGNVSPKEISRTSDDNQISSNDTAHCSQAWSSADQIQVVATASPGVVQPTAAQRFEQQSHIESANLTIDAPPRVPEEHSTKAPELCIGHTAEVQNGAGDDLVFVSATPRPKVAGKGISAATLAAWESEQDQDDDVQCIAYQYWVTRRQWATSLSEDVSVDVMEQTLGPFHTLAEANAVAGKEIYPTQARENKEFTLAGWSYAYKQDADGLQTHTAEVINEHIETIVSRGMLWTFG